YFGGSLGSILPVPGWHRWGWAGCVAFVVAAQALVGVLVYRFWGAGGTAYARAHGVRPAR
ncbi:TPA: MFS transporter, partial [Burkholderia cepacia ATCC 25416]|nr:MFS transporter [Burkholderia cepacia ATCC 25416]